MNYIQINFWNLAIFLDLLPKFRFRELWRQYGGLFSAPHQPPLKPPRHWHSGKTKKPAPAPCCSLSYRCIRISLFGHGQPFAGPGARAASTCLSSASGGSRRLGASEGQWPESCTIKPPSVNVPTGPASPSHHNFTCHRGGGGAAWHLIMTQQTNYLDGIQQTPGEKSLQTDILSET